MVPRQSKNGIGGKPPDVKARDTRTIIKVGADFAGIGTFSLAMGLVMDDASGEMPCRWEHVFSCDNDPLCESLIKTSKYQPEVFSTTTTTRCHHHHHHHHPEVFYLDVLTRPQVDQLPKVDVYSFSAPCVTFSTLGKRDGAAGDGLLGMSSLIYIQTHLPALVISENVASIIHKKNRLCTSCMFKFEVFQKMFDTNWFTNILSCLQALCRFRLCHHEGCWLHR